MTEEEAFLAALQANPADDVTRLVYADWLDEHNEPTKAEYLRLVAAFAQRKDNLANASDKHLLWCKEWPAIAWRMKAGARFSLILNGFANRSHAVEWILAATGNSLNEVTAASRSLPYVVLGWVPLEVAWNAIGSLGSISGGYDICITPSELSHHREAPVYELVVGCSLSGPRSRKAPTGENEARAALVRYLAPAMNLSEEEAKPHAILNSKIVCLTGVTFQEAETRRLELMHFVRPRDAQRPWYLWAELRRITPANS